MERMGGPTVVRVGTIFELNDKLARVVAIAKTQKSFTNIPVVYTTYERAMRYVPRERRILSYVLAKHKDGVPVEDVVQRIRTQTGLGAFTQEDFGFKTYMWVLVNTGIGINFGTTILLGFIVGMAIAGQTFYLFTIENLRQFGALKAMGASSFTLARMILLQAFTVGLTGYGIGIGLATVFGFLTAQGGNLPFEQRVAIARALVNEPRLLICDEPTAALDGPNGQKIMELLREVGRSSDRCVIVVTHDSRIFHFGDRMPNLTDGRIINIEQIPQEGTA